MLSAAVINMANGVYQGCVYGTAADLPMKYTNAVTIGMNLSGTLSALLMIASIAIAPDPQKVAIYFFSSAVVFLLICVITYFYMLRNVSSTLLGTSSTGLLHNSDMCGFRYPCL